MEKVKKVAVEFNIRSSGSSSAKNKGDSKNPKGGKEVKGKQAKVEAPASKFKLKQVKKPKIEPKDEKPHTGAIF
jgi:hypothetical protein